MKKQYYMLLAAILLLFLWGCAKQKTPPQESSTTLTATVTKTPFTIDAGTQKTTEKINDLDHAMNLYGEFLAGERNPKGHEYPRGAIDRYAYFDMNGDGIPELHVQFGITGNYYILSCKDSELFFWGVYAYCSEPLNNGAVLTERPVGMNGIVSYSYFEFDFCGNEQLRIDFAKASPNSEGFYDKNSDYFFENTKVSKDKWDALAKKYFEIGSDKIEWISIVLS